MKSVFAETWETLKRYRSVFPEELERHRQLAGQLAAGEDVFSRSNMHGHVTTSATVLNGTGTRVVLIHHKVLEKWLPPGGHYEHPGSLWESAQREVEEETGLVGLRVHPWAAEHLVPVDIDTHPIPANLTKQEGQHFHHDFRFLAVASEDLPLNAQIAEVNDARWSPIAALSNSPDGRVRALHRKLSLLGIV